MKKLFSNEQEQYIMNHYQTMKYKQIANNLGCNYTATQICGWVHSKGLKRIGGQFFRKKIKNI